MSYLLKGGLVVTFNKANQPVSFKADVLVDGSTIAKVANDIQVPPEVKVIDCAGKWITPGMVDLHRCASTISCYDTLGLTRYAGMSG